MPELPDVETFRRYFDKHALHQRIIRLELKAPRLLDNISPEELEAALHGRSFLSSRRHGKVLFAQTDGNAWLTLHFGMSGFLSYFRDPGDEPPHDRCLISFDGGGHLAYDNRRMIGKIGLAPSPEEYVRRRNIGPDALSVDVETFKDRLADRSGAVKPTLMDQELIAGIGNVYADEILFQAGIHPETKVALLDDRKWRKLYQVSAEVLKQAVASGADAARMPSSFLLAQRIKKGHCPRCAGELRQLKVAGRTSYFCPSCQPPP